MSQIFNKTESLFRVYLFSFKGVVVWWSLPSPSVREVRVRFPLCATIHLAYTLVSGYLNSLHVTSFNSKNKKADFLKIIPQTTENKLEMKIRKTRNENFSFSLRLYHTPWNSNEFYSTPVESSIDILNRRLQSFFMEKLFDI